jgi:hypothetical protein
MDRFAVMLLFVKRVPPAIIGIAALFCLNTALIAFGWIAASEVTVMVDPVAEGSWTSPDLDAPPAAPEHARAYEQNDPVLVRPIFFASRKPFEPPPAQAATLPPAAPKPPPPDPTFVVDGIMLTLGARRAHLRQPHEIDGQWHETGQVIDGWKIVQIDTAGIVLEQADRRLAMHLYSFDSHAFRMERLSSRRTAQ